jgi:hypothetical protein
MRIGSWPLGFVVLVPKWGLLRTFMGSTVMHNLTMCTVMYYIKGHDRFIFQQGSEAILGAR